MNDHGGRPEISARIKYTRALRQVFLCKIKSTGKCHCDDLVPTDDFLDRLDLDEREDLGFQVVALHQIAGTTVRFKDLDLIFSPRHRRSETRRKHIVDALNQGHLREQRGKNGSMPTSLRSTLQRSCQSLGYLLVGTNYFCKS